MIFGEIMGGLVFALLIAGCVFVLRRTGRAPDNRVAGPPIPGDELTDHERQLAMDNASTMGEQMLLREQGQFPH